MKITNKFKNIKIIIIIFIITLLFCILNINTENLVGTFVSPVKRKDVLLRINELKVVEYYSR
jgi:hypothetical protein